MPIFSVVPTVSFVAFFLSTTFSPGLYIMFSCVFSLLSSVTAIQPFFFYDIDRF